MSNTVTKNSVCIEFAYFQYVTREPEINLVIKKTVYSKNRNIIYDVGHALTNVYHLPNKMPKLSMRLVVLIFLIRNSELRRSTIKLVACRACKSHILMY